MTWVWIGFTSFPDPSSSLLIFSGLRDVCSGLIGWVCSLFPLFVSMARGFDSLLLVEFDVTLTCNLAVASTYITFHVWTEHSKLKHPKLWITEIFWDFGSLERSSDAVLFLQIKQKRWNWNYQNKPLIFIHSRKDSFEGFAVISFGSIQTDLLRYNAALWGRIFITRLQVLNRTTLQINFFISRKLLVWNNINEFQDSKFIDTV